jgi:DNA-directed RNA polymerase subunit RPC12/RpoP
MSGDIRRKLKKFRLNLFIMLVAVIAPLVVIGHLEKSVPDVGNSPFFIGLIFFFVLIGTIVLFLFTHMKCPRCGEGYFSKTGLPKLLYGFRCQNCKFNVFLPYKEPKE